MKIRFKTFILFLLTLILFIGGMLMLSNNPHYNSYKLVRAIYSNNVDQVNEIINKNPNSVNSSLVDACTKNYFINLVNAHGFTSQNQRNAHRFTSIDK